MTTASLRSVYPGPGGFDPRQLRREFPIFGNNPGLVFLDSGASAQKPASVIDRVAEYYRTDYANVHRGVYRLSARSTELYEEAREKVRAFLNAADSREIVFVRNTTEAINLVAGLKEGRPPTLGDKVDRLSGVAHKHDLARVDGIQKTPHLLAGFLE